MPKRTKNNLISLIQQLTKLPKETEWVEFKENNSKPDEIGEYISSISNSATLCDKTYGYVVWGIRDSDHAIVGTKFCPKALKVGNEELGNWLVRLLEPKIIFQFYEVSIEDKKVVLLEIPRATSHPVRFKKEDYIREGSYQKRLTDFPQKEKELWKIFDQTPFENGIALENLNDADVVQLIDYPAYFDLMKIPLPEDRKGIIDKLEGEDFIIRSEAGDWNITNLGAILFAKNLPDFRILKRKAIRVIQYEGNNRTKTIKEQEGTKGYANGFKGLISYINDQLPSNEIIGKSIRKTVPVYPGLAVRELVANALIHQDFSVSGAGPMVEIFADHMEISNPGAPIIDIERFLDSSPRSRNEAVASLMRRIGICEERGSGIDKVVFQTEFYQLPAPSFEVTGENTKVILFSPRPLTRMDKADRIRACYLHACLKYVNHEYMTNKSIRERFGIDKENKAMASRLIREAIDEGAIKLFDKSAPIKLRKYIPNWA